MITITLDQIRAKSPCESGWRKILSAEHLHGGDFSAPFPLADTIDEVGISDTIWALRCIEGHDRLKRRFAAWCAHQSAHLNTDPRVMAAIVAAENLADNDTPENRAAAYAARAAAYAADAAADAAARAATDAARAAAYAAAYAARAATDAADAAADAARAATDAADAAADAARAAAYAARAAAYAARAAAYVAAYAARAAAYAARETQANKLRACLTAGEWLND